MPKCVLNVFCSSSDLISERHHVFEVQNLISKHTALYWFLWAANASFSSTHGRKLQVETSLHSCTRLILKALEKSTALHLYWRQPEKKKNGSCSLKPRRILWLSGFGKYLISLKAPAHSAHAFIWTAYSSRLTLTKQELPPSQFSRLCSRWFNFLLLLEATWDCF